LHKYINVTKRGGAGSTACGGFSGSPTKRRTEGPPSARRCPTSQKYVSELMKRDTKEAALKRP